MKWLTPRRFAMVVLASAALLVFGCSDDPVQPAPPPCGYPCYKPLTDKENLIYNLILCYKAHNLPRYEDLLHPDFMWYNQAGVTPERCTRSEDVEITGNMFLAAEDRHPNEDLWIDKLDLVIYQPGTWTPIANFDSELCEDCWETTREYYLVLVMADGATTYIANGRVKFTVVPVAVNETKLYRIIRCDDLLSP